MKAKIAHAMAKTLDMLMHAGKLSTVHIPVIEVGRPKDDQFGDYTSNIAFLLAKPTGQSPRDIATLLQKSVALYSVEHIEVAGAGHLNFFLTTEAYSEILERILKEKAHYGNSMRGDGEKVNNEFISANPTGPLHLGNARGGFYADTLSRILLKAGYDVTNEYYINDAGEQVLKLGHSVLQDSETVYAGDYIDELRGKVKLDQSVATVGASASDIVINDFIRPTVQDVMRVHFDEWVSEKKLIADGYVEKALEFLKDKKLTFKQDGALWLKTTKWGDDKDRVLVKQDGVKTYLASDCGYLLYKLERKFTALIETWGADHHGYTERYTAAARALGFTGKIHFTLVQLVKLMKDGVEVKMSKRAGNVVTIDELIETVGHDVARMFFLMYSPDTHMHFDLRLAEERSEKNPVYYVQYAYARLCSILRKAEETGLKASTKKLVLLTHPKERLLIRELLAFPELVETMSTELLVHPLPQYVIRLADRLHSFYADCQVIDEKEKELSEARLSLIEATRIVLGESMRLMGVSAPEKM